MMQTVIYIKEKIKLPNASFFLQDYCYPQPQAVAVLHCFFKC